MMKRDRVINGGKSEIENPKSRSQKISRRSSGVEHFLGKEEVMGSNPIVGSIVIESILNIK